MVVLSLFDGISCGQYSLQQAGIPVKFYMASEINPYAMKKPGGMKHSAMVGSVTLYNTYSGTCRFQIPNPVTSVYLHGSYYF